MRKFRDVILGGGVVAGYAATEYLKRGGEGAALAIVSAEDRPPYDRPPLSKDVLQGDMDPADATIGDDGTYGEGGVELILGTRVSAIDPGSRRLETGSGEPIGYESLLIATGSRVRRLDVPGARDLANVFALRTAPDADRITAAAEDGMRALVVGGGFIGTEVAASLRQRGLDVALVYREDRLLADRPLTPEMSAVYERVFRDRGVDLVPGRSVERFEGQARVARVVLDSGREIEADLVVEGIGVVPRTRLLQETGIELADDGGVRVDEHLRTSIEGIRAAGDIACWPDRTSGRRRRVEHWDNAQAQGEHWARAMTGEDEPFVHVPYFFSDAFDLSWEYWGDREAADDVVYRGDLESGSFSAWWLAAGRVVAAFVMDRPDAERDRAEAWIEAGRRVDPAVLADQDADLPD